MCVLFVLLLDLIVLNISVLWGFKTVSLYM